MGQIIRHQVFISSTQADLISERESLIMALLTSKYIPCGMEMFTSSSDSQYEYIKRILDMCDYYVLILAGRYGSMWNDDISYTEMEFNYAKENGIPILSFLHEDPDSIPIKYSEKDPKQREKLQQFRQRAESNSMCNYWRNPDQLATKVLAALADEEKEHPRPGWIRTF